MGVNLTLIPIMEGFGYFSERKVLYPTERVSFSEAIDAEKLDQEIKRLHPRKLPEDKNIVLRERSGEMIDSNPYGERITYLFPKDFKNMFLPKGYHKWDKAVLSFVRKLPEDTPILLFWH